ncbi:hypothetical protein [Treponema berlinense]|uniref:hypothetical protein n=1 Tax=Treponema berlinense TaxID=225004 RepID=UPI002355644A|nr:hypothetical protein [Treponema berlinense]
MDNKSVAFFYFGRFLQPYKNSKNVIVRQQVAAKNIKKTQSRTKKHTGRAFRGYGVYRASGAAHLQATTTIANA